MTKQQQQGLGSNMIAILVTKGSGEEVYRENALNGQRKVSLDPSAYQRVTSAEKDFNNQVDGITSSFLSYPVMT